MTGWGDIAANIAGTRNIRHAVLTFNGTWGADQTQYPSDVVNGLAQFVDDGLCYEVPVPGPYSFGPIGGNSLTAPSYQQSVDYLVKWATDWITKNPSQTFILIGYSMGGEAASHVAISLMDGDLKPYLPNLAGGITFGNPCRGAGFHAPTIVDPGGHGISTTNMTQLPTAAGRVVWADYVHSPANGDPGLDMYGSVPNGQVGTDMSDVYAIATALQFNNLHALTQDMVNRLTKAAYDSGLLGSTHDGFTGLLEMGSEFVLGMIEDALGAPLVTNTAASAAGEAAAEGLKFMLAPGGPTAPHISYLGELPGYSNLVSDAIGFLHGIATLTPARCTA